jgi:UDP-N-acetyl-D-mannosaminuronate dehydrogenase
LIARYPNARVAALGLAFKANIDDFRESPARLVAATLARKYRERMSIVEPYATALPANSKAPAQPRSTSTRRWRNATSFGAGGSRRLPSGPSGRARGQDRL